MAAPWSLFLVSSGFQGPRVHSAISPSIPAPRTSCPSAPGLCSSSLGNRSSRESLGTSPFSSWARRQDEHQGRRCKVDQVSVAGSEPSLLHAALSLLPGPLPGLAVAVVELTLGEVSSSNLRIWLMNSRCCFSSSSWATACSLRCSFCCVPASSSRSHWFSCTRRRT